MTAIYNENDDFAADWLENLIAEKLIAHGIVDRRSIVDVHPSDLRGFTQVHLFAGYGTWSLALRLAGWPDDRPVWSASCPCPPFSAAGKGQRCPACGSASNICHPFKTGHFVCLACGCDRWADERHLSPELGRLIAAMRPEHVFGEQVASADGRLWLGALFAYLEMLAYTPGGADTCAAGFRKAHIRQRLYWMAHSAQQQHWGRGSGARRRFEYSDSSSDGWLADTYSGEFDGQSNGQGRVSDRPSARWEQGDSKFTPGSRPIGLDISPSGGRQRFGEEPAHGKSLQAIQNDLGRLDHSPSARRIGQIEDPKGHSRNQARLRVLGSECGLGRLAYADGGQSGETRGIQSGGQHRFVAEDGRIGRVADGASDRRGEECPIPGRIAQGNRAEGFASGSGAGRSDYGADPLNVLRYPADWLFCRDGKWRPVEPGTFPLADAGSIRSRVGKLRAAGNALDLDQAEAFIRSFLEAEALSFDVALCRGDGPGCVDPELEEMLS